MANNTGKKWGGRKKGTPNKANSVSRTLIQGFLDDNYEEFTANFSALEPRDKTKVYIQMMEFIMPKMKSIELNDKTDQASRLDELFKSLREDELKSV